MSNVDRTTKKESGNRPIRSEYIRFNARKSLQIKLWGSRPSKFEDGYPMPAYIELEEIEYSEDGTPSYGSSVRVTASQSAFALAEYLTDFLKEARRINRRERKRE